MRLWSKILFLHPGPICIFTSKEEVYGFIQINYTVKYPDPFASPRVRTIAHEQYVFVKNREGFKEPVKINSQSVPTINPNLSRIMRSQNHFYLITALQQITLPDVFAWNGIDFARLSVGESISLIERIGYNTSLSVPANESVIDAETNRSGWKLAYMDRDPFFFWRDPSFDFTDPSTTPVKFSWNGNNYAIKGYNRIIPSMLQLVNLDIPGELPYDLVTFDSKEIFINTHDYQQLLERHQDN